MNKPQTAQRDSDTSDAAVVDLIERNWLPRHCRGDELAFDALLTHYRSLVFTFLCRYGIEPQNRDDLFQDIFLKIHQSAAQYRPSEPLRPWLISIVLNTVRNFRRDSGRRKHFMTHLKAVSNSTKPGANSAPDSTTRSHEPGLDQQVEYQSTVLWLEGRITTLPERQREVLVLSTLKGLRMKEIANILAIPENTVKTHLRRARLALSEDLVRREAEQQPLGGENS